MSETDEERTFRLGAAVLGWHGSKCRTCGYDSQWHTRIVKIPMAASNAASIIIVDGKPMMTGMEILLMTCSVCAEMKFYSIQLLEAASPKPSLSVAPS